MSSYLLGACTGRSAGLLSLLICDQRMQRPVDIDRGKDRPLRIEPAGGKNARWRRHRGELMAGRGSMISLDVGCTDPACRHDQSAIWRLGEVFDCAFKSEFGSRRWMRAYFNADRWRYGPVWGRTGRFREQNRDREERRLALAARRELPEQFRPSFPHRLYSNITKPVALPPGRGADVRQSQRLQDPARSQKQ